MQLFSIRNAARVDVIRKVNERSGQVWPRERRRYVLAAVVRKCGRNAANLDPQCLVG